MLSQSRPCCLHWIEGLSQRLCSRASPYSSLFCAQASAFPVFLTLSAFQPSLPFAFFLFRAFLSSEECPPHLRIPFKV